jgi:hypothetical protein
MINSVNKKMVDIYLYYNPIQVWLVQSNRGAPNRNMNPNDVDFKLYKGVTNEMDFLIRNLDRKPIPLLGKKLLLTVVNDFNNEIVLQKPMQILDPYKGQALARITPGEVQDFEIGYYRYTVLMINEDGNETLLYTDMDQRARGFFELKDGALPPPKPSIQLLASAFLPVMINNQPITTVYVSSALRGDALLDLTDGLMTAAVYLENWIGTFTIQGTLESVPPDAFESWIEIEKKIYSGFTGIDWFNIEGNYSWIRFVYENDPINEGFFTKVLFKN